MFNSFVGLHACVDLLLICVLWDVCGIYCLGICVPFYLWLGFSICCTLVTLALNADLAWTVCVNLLIWLLWCCGVCMLLYCLFLSFNVFVFYCGWMVVLVYLLVVGVRLEGLGLFELLAVLMLSAWWTVLGDWFGCLGLIDWCLFLGWFNLVFAFGVLVICICFDYWFTLASFAGTWFTVNLVLF